MMLSQSMHQYAPNGHFSPLPSSSGDMDPGNGIGHQSSLSANSHKTSSKARHHPYDSRRSSSGSSINDFGEQVSGASAAGPIRRRISRACDQCNQLRTKCDGKLPCQHCQDFTLKCEYARERKKRGKASRKDIQQQQLQQQQQAQQGGSRHNSFSGPISPTDGMRVMNGGPRNSSDLPPPPRPGTARKPSSSAGSSRTLSMGDIHDQSQMHHHHMTQHHHHLPTPESPSIHMSHDGMSAGLPMHFDRMSPFSQQSTAGISVGDQTPRMMPAPHGGLSQPSSATASAFPNNEFILSPHHPSHQMNYTTNGASPIGNLLGAPTPEDSSQSWMPMPSPPPHAFSASTGIRYPVLMPLMPHIATVIPAVLAYDLLDLYFTTPASSFFQPASPYVLTHVFRKQSFLHPVHPRQTSPALLCAILWVAAQTCDAPFLTATPTARGRVCQKLLELCISLLRPLVHTSFASAAPQHPQNPSEQEGGNSVGVGLGTLGTGPSGSPGGREGVGAAGTLDDVLTYAHLGIVISASEFKAASLRWWHAAWTLARELKLNREVPVESMVEQMDEELDGHHSPGDTGPGSVHSHPTNGTGPGGSPTHFSEEEQEERRRTWWLLYVVDRHLALCYNRPLALLDVECEGLYLPMDEVTWQSGDFFGAHDTHSMYSQNPVSPTASVGSPLRRTAPCFEITGYGLFQFFLPLMTILGEVVELHHARNRPKFGVARQPTSEGANGMNDGFEDLVQHITQQLENYSRSLQEFESANINPNSRENGSPDVKEESRKMERQFTESEIQTKIVVSYGTHVMHVLHILLSGKWDPISMLDDDDLWISSHSFISSTAHAVSAAEAISNILKYDPDLSFMPYFFGIYLLQGSFLLLLIADKLQGEASEAVVTACETIVRAHEVCVVTLNTEYQRNFRKVMRSALNQVRGRGAPEDVEEQKLRRREVLQLYRWCGNGTGLAL